jgi:hypothetical protein
MLVSRLDWKGHFESTALDATASKSGDISGSSAATALRQDLGTDYLVWGSVTISGQEASLDVNMLGPKDKTTRTSQTPLDELIPTMEDMATELGNQVFGKPEEPEAAAQPAEPANPNFIVNETTTSARALNPQFRYEGNPNTPGRWRSQSLDFESVGAISCDVDGDGQNEVIICGEHSVHVYAFVDRRLKELASYETNNRTRFLHLSHMDIDRDGQQEIIAAATFVGDPKSFVFHYKDQALEIVDEEIDFYLSVVRTPPEYGKELIGQQKGVNEVFERDVHRVTKMGGKYQLGSILGLPEKASVFNFCYLPLEQDYKVIIAYKDKLEVYNSSNAFQYVTDHAYAGSGVKLEEPQNFPGLGKAKPSDYESQYHFLPTRLIPANLDQEGPFELVANRSISVSAQIFNRYRNFPQGAIHCLAWDGVGLSLVWKTRTIKGTVQDYGLADLDNDGGSELFVCLNTYPGTTGFTRIRTIVLSYDLDIGAEELSGLLIPGRDIQQ